jgi:hypothetical protein
MPSLEYWIARSAPGDDSGVRSRRIEPFAAPFKQHFKRPRKIPSHGTARENTRSHFGGAATILPANMISATREEQ